MLAMLKALGQDDLEIVVAAPIDGRFRPRINNIGIPVIPLQLRDNEGNKRPDVQIHTHLIQIVNQVVPDLVHANSLSMGRMIGRIAPQLPIPCTTHLRDIIKLSKAAIRDLNQNTGLVAVSQATQDFHVQQGLVSNKVQVIHNGVDTDLFHPAPANGSLRQELGLHDNDVMIANIGQICLRKGQVHLAHALVSMTQEYPELHLLIVGERYSQKQESIDYEKRIRKLFDDVSMGERLHFLGFRNHMEQLLNEVDLVVHTAHQEPLGRVLLEAAACGRPIIATDVGGTREILSDEDTALLIPANDIQALSTAIRHSLEDKALRERLGCRAREQAVEKFALIPAAERLRAYWRSFL